MFQISCYTCWSGTVRPRLVTDEDEDINASRRDAVHQRLAVVNGTVFDIEQCQVAHAPPPRTALDPKEGRAALMSFSDLSFRT